MSKEVEFINSRGQATFMPESVGDSLGLQRASEFTPDEVKKESKEGKSATPSKPTFGQAVSLLREFMDTATDEEKHPERLDELSALGSDLLQYTGHDFEAGNTEQTGEPSLIDAIAVVEKHVDGDGTKTPAQKKKLKEHLQQLLDGSDSTPPSDTPPAE